MATSQVSICNSALVKVGADPISSITQETKSARILNTIWDEIVDAVMRAHPWKCATRRATLAPNSTTPDFGYDYEYDIPTDWLRPLDTDPDNIDFVVEDGKILTNEDSLDIRYVFRNSDPSSWDADFAEALAWRLAKEIAYALTQSAALVDQCDKSYKAALAEARFVDGTVGVVKGFESDDWTDVRR